MKRSSPERDREWYKGGGDRGGYIVEKRYKLGKQFARGVELKDDFMKGVAVWIDGKPESISVEELRRMILETGGNFYASKITLTFQSKICLTQVACRFLRTGT